MYARRPSSGLDQSYIFKTLPISQPFVWKPVSVERKGRNQRLLAAAIPMLADKLHAWLPSCIPDTPTPFPWCLPRPAALPAALSYDLSNNRFSGALPPEWSERIGTFLSSSCRGILVSFYPSFQLNGNPGLRGSLPNSWAINQTDPNNRQGMPQ